MVQCPACKDYDIRRSGWSSIFERILFGLMLRRPVRCYVCFRRFHTWIFAEVKPRGPRVPRNREKPSLPPVEKQDEIREDDRLEEIGISAKAS